MKTWQWILAGIAGLWLLSQKSIPATSVATVTAGFQVSNSAPSGGAPLGAVTITPIEYVPATVDASAFHAISATPDVYAANRLTFIGRRPSGRLLAVS